MRLSFSTVVSAAFVLSNVLLTSASLKHDDGPLRPRHVSPFARHRNRAATIPANWALVGCFTDA